jgi:hypothetical protein
MTRFSSSCPECNSPAVPSFYSVGCVESRCPNYDEALADEFWDRFRESAAIVFDPWEDETTLPGL